MRGKHAATAAKRRAESAETQLDRLMEEVTDLRRKVKAYKSAFDELPAVKRALAEAKRDVGIPVAQHEAALRMAEAEARSTISNYEANWATIFSSLHEVVNKRKVSGPESVGFLSAQIIRAMRNVPRKGVLAYLAQLGISREERRKYLESESADIVQFNSMKDVNHYLYVNHAYGGDDRKLMTHMGRGAP